MSVTSHVKSGNHALHETSLPLQSSDLSLETNDQILQRISPFFSVKKTSYGGRGCFTDKSIEKDTSLLQVKFPVGSGVVRPFRKEVCMWCFHYENGRTMKFRLLNRIYFCSAGCQSDFIAHDFDGTLSSTICAAEELFLKCSAEIFEDDVADDVAEISQIMDSKWVSVLEWENQVFRMKPSKRTPYYPTVTAEDYTEIQYIISTLHNMRRCESRRLLRQPQAASQKSLKYLKEMSPEEAMDFELQTYEMLQSLEVEKVKRYPYLLLSYLNIFKFVRLVAPESWLQFVTPQNVRNILGRNLTNAFGIWSAVSQSEDKEYFGFGMYPSASFFNHSCASNIKKVRKGAGFEFIASRDILPGEELCISYGIKGDESVTERQEILSEWFFTCACSRCNSERPNL
ncbi:SET domain-containing protein [Metschnikowia bicuspidata var. bicuspidata NRRL YB-4993]|uniref:SET domain-containing protein n=1 Tax=Metschnikowia bicuspidata var. bicuspidata NRRL YB-4993 TaxID=869754 RepID=A0A1A0H537_9ASCO|nr:SET domain-containing protein [Metschnikowia bicuspidata var. bicuspidata NRRL YB-4993]OBA19151.1 SET domain-containing protein [Metschnikowia bicuspidata var. bicuspidata NRRL YB-4993]